MDVFTENETAFQRFVPGDRVYFTRNVAEIDLSVGGANFVVFANVAQLGLRSSDVIDALCILDRGIIGQVDPGSDLALFSLAPNSPSLAALGFRSGEGGAHIFFTDFDNGAPVVAGPGNIPYPFPLTAENMGLLRTDNIDGLDVVFTSTFLGLPLDANFPIDRPLLSLPAGIGDPLEPVCLLTKASSSGIEIVVQDGLSGITAVNVLKSENATVSIPPFAVGTTDPLLVTATKIKSSSSARVELEIIDLAGNKTRCDPVLTTLTVTSGQRSWQSQTFTGIPQGESKITIQNGTPGLRLVTVLVNRRNVYVIPLRAGMIRNLDVASAMNPGNKNTITLIGYGSPGASADIMIAE